MKHLSLSKVIEKQMNYIINNTNTKSWMLNYGVIDERHKKCIQWLRQ
jgi:hypothetical protein